MKKIILFFVALFFVTGAVQSQVKIGKNDAPQKGAILDLNADPAYKGGLLLPNVNIENPEVIPNDFTDASLRGLGSVPALAGMIVWNTHTGSEGVYMWDGDRWTSLQCIVTSDCTNAPSGVTINGFSGTYNLGVEFDVTCQATSDGATVYIWNVPAGLEIVSGRGTNALRLKGITGGTYSGSAITCVVANGCGVSAAATSGTNVKINDCTTAPAAPASITLQATVDAGVPFTVSVTTPVTGATSYDWSFPAGFSVTAPGNTASVQVTATGGTYTADKIGVKAVNACGESDYTYASNGITVVSCGNPTISTQSSTTVNVNIGQTAALSVSGTITGGPGTVTYQWYSNTSASNSGGTIISGAQSVGYNAPTDVAGTRYYYCVVGTSCSAATVNSDAFTVTTVNPCGTPTITAQSSTTVNVNQGATATLSVTATTGSGTGSVTYLWYKNTTNTNSGGTLISGETSAGYSAPTTTPGTTYYYCVVGISCSAQTVSSTPFVVTVTGSGAGSVTGDNGTYTTWCFTGTPGNICWMTQNSMEGTYASEGSGTYTGRGYYYNWADASASSNTNACPSGWTLPTRAQWDALKSYLNGTPDANFKSAWYASALAGRFRRSSQTWLEWSTKGYWWSGGSTGSNYYTTGSSLSGAEIENDAWYSVRCVKSN